MQTKAIYQKKNYQKASFASGLQRMGAILLLLPQSRGSIAKLRLCTSRARLWHPTFALRLLEDLGFFIQIIFLGTFDLTGLSSRHHLILMGSLQFSLEHKLASGLDLQSCCPRDFHILRALPALNSNRWYRGFHGVMA